MGSPEDEPWRSADETQHTVTVSDFYMSPYEVRQSEYAAVMGENPSNFSGDDLPVENVSWLEAVAFCNALSERENLTPAYTVDGETVTWDRSAKMAVTVNLYYSGVNGNARKFAQEMTTSGIVSAIRAEDGNLRYEYFFPMEDEETVSSPSHPAWT